MDWTAIGAATAVAALAYAMFRQQVRHAYTQGQTDQRIKALEQALEEAKATAPAIAALTASVEGLTTLVGQLKEFLNRRIDSVEGRVDGRPRAPARRSVIA